jgi:uncharacterized protein YheU (UPF0270 family)
MGAPRRASVRGLAARRGAPRDDGRWTSRRDGARPRRSTSECDLRARGRRGPRPRSPLRVPPRPDEAAEPSRRTRRPGVPMRAASVDAGVCGDDGVRGERRSGSLRKKRRVGASVDAGVCGHDGASGRKSTREPAVTTARTAGADAGGGGKDDALGRAAARESAGAAACSRRRRGRAQATIRAELRRGRAVIAWERQGAPPCAAWRRVGAHRATTGDGLRGATECDVGARRGSATSALDVGAALDCDLRSAYRRAPTKPPRRRVGRDAPAFPCARRASTRESAGTTARSRRRHRKEPATIRAELRRGRAVIAWERQGAPPCAAWRFVGAHRATTGDGLRGATALDVGVRPPRPAACGVAGGVPPCTDASSSPAISPNWPSPR